MEVVVADLFAANDFRIVVTSKIGSRQITVGHLSGKALGQRNPDWLGHIGHEYPQVPAFHQDYLSTLGGRLGYHDNRILVSLGKNTIFSELRLFVRTQGIYYNVNLKTVSWEANLVSLFHYTSRKCIIGWRGGISFCQYGHRLEQKEHAGRQSENPSAIPFAVISNHDLSPALLRRNH
jgi:hypothetical protein